MRHTRDQVRDDISGAHHAHGVADAQILAMDLARIVERGTPDRNAADLDGVQDGDGREHARASDLHEDAAYGGCGLARRKLVRDGPPRMTCGGAKTGTRGHVVDLHDDAVDLDGKRGATPFERVVVFERTVERADDAVFRTHRQPEVAHRRELLGMPREGGPALACEHVVEDDLERSARRDSRVELAERACRRIARVGEGWLALARELPIKRAKRLLRHEHLAAHEA
jgi:hypothetical protein